MDITKIRSFVMVSQLGSISAAARTLRLTQPAVSQHLRSIEQDLDAVVLERRRSGVVLTEAGKSFLPHAQAMLSHFDQALSDIQALRGEPQGPVTLGLPTTVAAAIGAALIREISSKFPGIKLRIVEAMSGHLREWVDTGRVDLVVLFQAVGTHLAAGEILATEPLYLVSSGEDLRFDGVRCVNASELSRLPLILPGRPHALRTLIDRFAADQSIDLNVSVELDATEAMRQLIRADRGYTILPLSSIQQDVGSGRLHATRIVSPPFERQLILCRSPMSQYSIAFQTIRNELKRLLQ